MIVHWADTLQDRLASRSRIAIAAAVTMSVSTSGKRARLHPTSLSGREFVAVAMRHVADNPPVQNIYDLRMNNLEVTYNYTADDGSILVRTFVVKALQEGQGGSFGFFYGPNQAAIPAGTCVGYISGYLRDGRMDLTTCYDWVVTKGVVPFARNGHELACDINSTAWSLANTAIGRQANNLEALACSLMPGVRLMYTTQEVQAGEQLLLSYSTTRQPTLVIAVGFYSGDNLVCYSDMGGQLYYPNGTKWGRRTADPEDAWAQAEVRQFNSSAPDFGATHPWLSPDHIKQGSSSSSGSSSRVALSDFQQNPYGCVFELGIDDSLVYSPALRLVCSRNGTGLHPAYVMHNEDIPVPGVFVRTKKTGPFAPCNLGHLLVS